MITFNRVAKIWEQAKGIWYVQIVLDQNGVEYESEFLKFMQADRPDLASITARVTRHIQFRNNPIVPEPLIPDSPPDLPALTPIQRSVLSVIWNVIKTWLRKLLGQN